VASLLRVFWSPLPTPIPPTASHSSIIWHYIVSITTSLTDEATEKQSSVMWLHVVWLNVPNVLEGSAASNFRTEDTLQHPDDGGSHLIWNVCNFPSDYTVPENKTVSNKTYLVLVQLNVCLKHLWGCHTFSRQPYGSNVHCAQRDLQASDSGSHHMLIIESSNFPMMM
jgi:hypothetical protein